MNEKVISLYLIICGLLFCNAFSFADDYSSAVAQTYYPVKNGITIELVDGTGNVAIGNTQVSQLKDNKIQFVGAGTSSVQITNASKSMTYNFFVWNTLLKGGTTDVYSDSALSNKIGTVSGVTYFICEEQGTSLLIKNALYSTGGFIGSPNENLTGKYLNNYHTNSGSSNQNFEYAFSGGKGELYLSLKDLSQVKKVTKTVVVTVPPSGTSTGGSQVSTGSYGSTGGYSNVGEAFLAECSENIKWLYNYGYTYKSGGSGIPPYKGNDRNSSNRSSAIDCVGYVRWCLYEYGKTNGVSAFTKSPYCSDYVPTWMEDAQKISKGKSASDWMQKFDVVYVAANHNSGLGRESGITISRIKSLLKPGDILVYTGGPRYKPNYSTHGVSANNSNHIDVFAGFTNEDSSNAIGVKIYSCGDAPSSHSEHKNGSPVKKKYYLNHKSDAHGFWDVTAVLRLKSGTLKATSTSTSSTFESTSTGSYTTSSGKLNSVGVGQIIARAANVMYQHRDSFAYHREDPDFSKSLQGIKTEHYLRGPYSDYSSEYTAAGKQKKFFVECAGFTQLCTAWSLGGNSYFPAGGKFRYISMPGSVLNHISKFQAGDILVFDGHYAVYVGGNKMVHIVNNSKIPSYSTWTVYKDDARYKWCSNSLKGVFRMSNAEAAKIDVSKIDPDLTKIKW